jgi:hypothetical protein
MGDVRREQVAVSRRSSLSQRRALGPNVAAVAQLQFSLAGDRRRRRTRPSAEQEKQKALTEKVAA